MGIYVQALMKKHIAEKYFDAYEAVYDLPGGFTTLLPGFEYYGPEYELGSLLGMFFSQLRTEIGTAIGTVTVNHYDRDSRVTRTIKCPFIPIDDGASPLQHRRKVYNEALRAARMAHLRIEKMQNWVEDILTGPEPIDAALAAKRIRIIARRCDREICDIRYIFEFFVEELDKLNQLIAVVVETGQAQGSPTDDDYSTFNSQEEDQPSTQSTTPKTF